MHDPASELLRIPIPRTPVNKGEKEGQSCYAPALYRGYYLNWKLALCSLPSLSLRTNWRVCPLHAFSVFHT